MLGVHTTSFDASRLKADHLRVQDLERSHRYNMQLESQAVLRFPADPWQVAAAHCSLCSLCLVSSLRI